MNCYRCLRAMIQLGIERDRTVWHCVFCDADEALDIFSETPDPYFPFFRGYELDHRGASQVRPFELGCSAQLFKHG